MKAPQERKTAKIIADRNLGHPNIKMDATDETLSLTELGEDHWPPVFRGADEIRTLRDFAQSWLDHHEAQEEGEADE